VKDAFVADASVGLAWAVESQSSPATDRLLTDVTEGRPFVVPVLWAFEIVNGLLVLKRRKRVTHDQYLRAKSDLSLLAQVVDEDGARLAWNQIANLADTQSLSIYDAIYLELAVRRQVPLASRDTALNGAARRCGVKTLL
jgi:predicted nucleic acid-binding protein